ncbi:MAG: hypothetical protein AAF620_00150 [Bacteroidota bacterium]
MYSLTDKDFADILDNVSYDSRRKNIIADCPICGAKAKLGVSIVKDLFPWQCFKCAASGGAWKLLHLLGRLDLLRGPDFETDLVDNYLLFKNESKGLDLDLPTENLPIGYRRVAGDDYLDSRGWNDDDYFYFEGGRSRHWKYKDYVILPVYMHGRITGYVCRHVWPKWKIDQHNTTVKKAKEGYLIPRYKNSTGNEMAKMLYGYDQLIEGRTSSVILVEGAFDVHNLTRQLLLYDVDQLKCVCTFGKKISDEQVYWLQAKGVKQLIILFDPDATGMTKYKSKELNKYFDVLVGYIDFKDENGSEKDAGDLSVEEIERVLNSLYHPIDYGIEKVAIKTLK